MRIGRPFWTPKTRRRTVEEFLDLAAAATGADMIVAWALAFAVVGIIGLLFSWD